MKRLTKQFGKRVKVYRMRKRWSQEVTAKKTGVTREYIARLELGLHDPSLTTVAKLARAFKVRIATLIG